ncbi:MAG: hypothetical protein K8R68_03955, partial [Bacteroidales bacterium]|nr:hypothetical protein [Bacteroidales bacterium]
MISNVHYVSLSGDFHGNDPDHLWIIDYVDSYLKKTDVATCAVIDSVAMPCPLADGIWSCITFDKTTGQLYAIATSTTTSDSRLYEVDHITGFATESLQLGSVGIVSGTFDMFGVLYALDLDQDNVYTIDIKNLSIDLLGPAGFDANYAQGMSCNPETNEVYLAAWHEGIGPELRLLDKDTGATTFISDLPGETTAFGFPMMFPLHAYHSVTEVYTDPEVQDGDTLWVVGYYLNPENNFLLESYGAWFDDEVMPPYSIVELDGIPVPPELWNGGLLVAKGTVLFLDNPNPYHPEDSLTALLNVFEIEELVTGSDGPPGQNGDIEDKNKSGNNFNNSEVCDSCKFAILISGGVRPGSNHAKYWETVEALYKFKIDNQGYCPDNVFVNYYKGDSEDPAAIPHNKVDSATNTSISNNMTEISKRVAACTKAGKPATFQKMVSNHGKSNGEINLLGTNTLKLTDLKKMQQKIIDSCCTTIYDEFLQCYGGQAVDTMATMDIKNKTKLYINSNAGNDVPGRSPHDSVHRYLEAKINSLTAGNSYEDAVVDAKLAYDDYLRWWINYDHYWAEKYRERINNLSWYPDWNKLLELYRKLYKKVADSANVANRICKSRNVSVTPFKEYCQLEEYVIPPGGQLVLDFKGENKHCGNITIYWVDPETGALKYKVFNWNIEGSAGYSGNNKRRVVNGDADIPTTFWVHNDDGTFVVTANANGNQNLPEDTVNTYEYPGTSLGGNDNSSAEFSFLTQSEIWIENIDQVPFSLNNLPAQMGMGNPIFLGGSFTINPEDIYASSMVLHLDLVEVLQPGVLFVNSSGSIGMIEVDILEPGKYDIPLGDMRYGGPYGFIEMNVTEYTAFSFDCWGIHSAFEPLLIDCNVFLEGPFVDGVMNTDLNPSFIPLSQPFNTYPWNYPGT